MADNLPPMPDDLYGIPQEEMDALNSEQAPDALANEPSAVEDAKPVLAGVDPRVREAIKKRIAAGGFKGVDPRVMAALKKKLGMDEPVNGPEAWAKQNPVAASLEAGAKNISEGYQAISGPIESVPSMFDTLDPSEGIPMHRRLLGAINPVSTGVEALAKTGRAVVGAGDAVQAKIDPVLADVRDEGVSPTYAARKAVELITPGMGILSAPGQLKEIVPQDRLGVIMSILGIKRKEQAFNKPGELPLKENPSAINPAIAEKYKDEAPFKNEAARERLEKQAMTDAVREKELSGQLDSIANEQGALEDQLIGDTVDFGNDAEIGAAIKDTIIKRKGVVKSRLAEADKFITEQAEKVPAVARRAAEVAKAELLDSRTDLIDLPGDTPLEKLLSKVTTAKDKFAVDGGYGTTSSKPTTLADLIQAHKDIGSELRKPSSVDAAGNVSPRGNVLFKIKEALKQDISSHVVDATDRLSGATKELKKSIAKDWAAKLRARLAIDEAKIQNAVSDPFMGVQAQEKMATTKAIKAVGLASETDAASSAAQKAFDAAKAAKEVAVSNDLSVPLAKLNSRWKNFYDTFGKQNEVVTSALKTQDPVKVYELAKQSEDSLSRIQAATKGDVYKPTAVFREAKAKIITEILEGMQKLDAPEKKLDFIEKYLKDKSGKEAMTKFLTDGDRAALRGMVTQEFHLSKVYGEFAEIAKRFEENNPQTAHSKRLGELAKYSTRSGDRVAQTAMQLAKDTMMNTYGNLRGAAHIGGAALLIGINHPILGAALFASKLKAPLFAHLYFNNVGFRTAVNSFMAGPSKTTVANVGRAAAVAAKAGDNADKTRR